MAALLSIKANKNHQRHPVENASILIARIENTDAAPTADLQPSVATLPGLPAILRFTALGASAQKIAPTGVTALVRTRASFHARTFNPGVARSRCCCRIHVKFVTFHSTESPFKPAFRIVRIQTNCQSEPLN
jgi:hypothetical protein